MAPLPMKKIQDEVIIQQIKHCCPLENDKAVIYLYQRVYPQVRYFIKVNKGTEIDVPDVFQDALMILFKAIKERRLKRFTNVEAYLFAICKNRWFKQLKKKKKETSLISAHDAIPMKETPLGKLLFEEKQEMIAHVVSQLSLDCQQIIVYFYDDQLSLQAIAEKMNLLNNEVAKNKKSRCMKKLKTMINQSEEIRHILYG